MKHYIRILCVLTGILVGIVVPISKGAGAVEFDGLIEPYMVVNLGSGIPGIIQTVTVDRGDFVTEGRVLATLQSGVERARMDMAFARSQMEATIKLKQAQVEFEERKYKRLLELHQKGAIPFNQLDEAETNKVLAELQLQEAIEAQQLAELQFQEATEALKLRTICSPITGVVVERFLSPGEYVEDQPILKLAQMTPLNVEIFVPVTFLGSIKVGMRARVIPESPVGGEYIARVKIVDRVIDAASGTFGVRLELPNPEHRLPAGLKCIVRFFQL